MSKTAILRARVDSERKKSAEAVFDVLGLSVSDAIDVFFSQVCIHQCIPFPLTTRSHLNLSNATLKEIEHRYKERHPNELTKKALTEKTSMQRCESVSEVFKALKE